MDLSGIPVVIRNAYPACLDQPDGWFLHLRAGSFTVSATASDSDGTVTSVEFFLGTTKIGKARRRLTRWR